MCDGDSRAKDKRSLYKTRMKITVRWGSIVRKEAYEN